MSRPNGHIRAVIVEDEVGGRQALHSLLAHHCPDVNVVATASNVDDAFGVLTDTLPDIVFLDIRLADRTAFELLERLTPVTFNVIFTTAYDQYALQAIRYSAVDYLLKPVDPALLCEAVERARHRYTEAQNNQRLQVLMDNMRTEDREPTLVLSDLNGLRAIKVGSILYCSSQNSYTVFTLDTGQKVMVSKPLKEYEMLLEDKGFLRVHQSHLVSLAHATRYIKGNPGRVVMADGAALEVSRRRRDEFVHAFTRRWNRPV